MADITMDDMVIGAIVYDAVRESYLKPRVVRKIQVVGPMNEEDRYIPMLDHSSDRLFKLFPGDRGIAPVAYDNRVTQVFRTYEEAETAIKQWGDANPNFIEKD